MGKRNHLHVLTLPSSPYAQTNSFDTTFNSDTKVRRHWSANPQLATWVASQRAYAISFIEGDRSKRASITADKIARLHGIGFTFYINPAIYII